MTYKSLACFSVLAVSLASQSLFCQLTVDHTTKCGNFRVKSSGEITDLQATKSGFRTVRSSVVHLGTTVIDACGETLTVQGGEFSSAQEAKRFFEWNMQRASRTVAQSTLMDSNGKLLGYRAELILNMDGRSCVAIMWTSGARFKVILAPSFTNATELEKRYRD